MATLEVTDRLPTQAELISIGRHDILAAADGHHGGWRAVAARLGLRCGPWQHTLGYWRELDNLEAELRAFAREHCMEGEMPSARTLEDAGRRDLARQVMQHGGYQAIAQRLGWRFQRRGRDGRPCHYWDNFANLERELRAFLAADGLGTANMPSARELRDAGHGALVDAIEKHGGFGSVAGRLGLVPAYRRRARGKSSARRRDRRGRYTV